MKDKYYNISYFCGFTHYHPRNFETFDEAKEYIEFIRNRYVVATARIEEYTEGFNTRNWYLKENGEWVG